MTDSTQNTYDSICSWCGQPTRVIWVHGHGQCSHCGTNIDECCRGETCAVDDASESKTGGSE